MAVPSSPNGAPSPADATPPHPALMGVAQAVGFFHRAGHRGDAQAFYNWAAIHWEIGTYERAFEHVEKHLGVQTTVEADLKAADECIAAAIKAIIEYDEERMFSDSDAVEDLKEVLRAYRARQRKQEQEKEARGAAS
ncbi:hypothetical protein LTR36_010881 [Oleoguttula mirabilis]|uniref:Uncharacterized protein n=1 Tax=Oleoguttula mirabilis TaxID=1507867 RepID=A0AAV9J3J0_9PEZI|nr:hypothetical protein LTR36_010881 [Oleoguttula mirabilis]